MPGRSRRRAASTPAPSAASVPARSSSPAGRAARRGTGAVTVAEAEVGLLLAPDVESSRVRPPVRVAVGGGGIVQTIVPGASGFRTGRCRARRPAGRRAGRRTTAAPPRSRPGSASDLGDQPALVGVALEHDQAVRHQLRRRVIAGRAAGRRSERISRLIRRSAACCSMVAQQVVGRLRGDAARSPRPGRALSSALACRIRSSACGSSLPKAGCRRSGATTAGNPPGVERGTPIISARMTVGIIVKSAMMSKPPGDATMAASRSSTTSMARVSQPCHRAAGEHGRQRLAQPPVIR